MEIVEIGSYDCVCIVTKLVIHHLLLVDGCQTFKQKAEIMIILPFGL